MKKLLPLLLLCLACLGLAHAQIAVSMKSDKSDSIPGDPCFATLTITNHTGQTLNLRNAGNTPWVMINLQSDNGNEISNNKVLNMPPISIPAGQATTTRINLSQLYSLNKEGFFRAYAVIHDANSGQNYMSNKAFFNLRKGIRLWSQIVGIPKGMPREGGSCRFSVQSLSHKEGIDLYAIIEDATNNSIIRVARLGRWINLHKPTCRVDSSNVLHILFQNTASVFVHSSVDTAGRFGKNSFYKRGPTTIPSFALDANGKCRIVNGSPFDPTIPVDKPKTGDEMPW